MAQDTKAFEILGVPMNTRMLIINVDDFGMCHSVNESGIYVLKQGLASSCTIMMPCPWGFNALKILKENPDIKFGVHLTVISEHPYYRWGPMAKSENVPSLRDESGFFYSEERIDEFLNQVKLYEIETEFRAQIESVLLQDMKPTHLDSHCDIHVRREDIFNLTVSLSKEYGLALRVSNKPFIRKIGNSGYPTTDYEVLDSYRIKTTDKPSIFFKMLRELPAGLSEWALHPAKNTAELRAITESWNVRQADYDFCTSEEGKNIIAEERIQIVDYEKLQEFWKK